MITNNLVVAWAGPGLNVSVPFLVTTGSLLQLDEPIPASSTDLNVSFSADVSQIKAFLMLASQDTTVETNSDSAPANVFALKAGVPFVWLPGAPPLRDTAGTAVNTDITKLVVTTASLTEVRLQILAAIDPTPSTP